MAELYEPSMLLPNSKMLPRNGTAAGPRNFHASLKKKYWYNLSRSHKEPMKTDIVMIGVNNISVDAREAGH